MFGLSFVHIGFLAAAGAVSVPVLIHLLMRPRARTASIGSLRFLKLAMRETRSRRKIRHWLLLALRAAAIVLLALLFARPYFNENGGTDGEREVVVLIDRSASMSAIDSGETLFAHAQKAAAEKIADLAEGTVVQLAYFDSLGVTAAPNSHIDGQQQPGYARTDYGLALCWAKDVLLSSSRQYHKVFVLTDLQRAGLQGTACKGFPADVEVELLEVGNPLMGNLAVDKIEVSEATVRGQAPVAVTAHISNTGAFDRHNVTVRLRLEAGPATGTSLTQEISIAAGAFEPVCFSVPISEPGLYQGYLEIVTEDPLPGDNCRWVAFEARNAERMLLLDGEPGASVFRNETYFLEIALRLALPGQRPAITPYDLQYLAYDERKPLPDLANYRVVVLCNVSGLAVADLDRVARFVSAGGQLLVFTGGQVGPERYGPLSRSGLLGATVSGTSEATGLRLQTWKEDHPIFRPFSDPQRGDLRSLTFRKITKLKPTDGAQILAATQSGDPLLIEKRLGRGTVLVFASAVDCDWSHWAQSRLFVPLVHQMVGYLTERLPENGRIREEIAGPGTDKPPGILREDRGVVVRNVDPGESCIERCTPEEFCDAFELAHPGDAEQATQQVEASLLPGSQRPGEIWTRVVWILMAVLVFELFIANRTHA